MKRRDLLKELKSLNAEDLHGRARAMAEELMKLRFRKASGQLEQSHRLQLLKRDLARVQTLIRAARRAVSETVAAS